MDGLCLRKFPVTFSNTIAASRCCLQQQNITTTKIVHIKPNIPKIMLNYGAPIMKPPTNPMAMRRKVNAIVP